jgi:hypothetical protein
MKKCSTCKSEKDKSLFYADKSKKDGLSNVCKHCKKEYDTQYNIKNKKIISEKKSIYRNENKEILKLKAKKRNFENRIENVRRASRWAKNNKERVNLKNKIWISRNKEKSNSYYKKSYEKNKHKKFHKEYERKKTDCIFNLKCKMRSRIGTFVKKQFCTSKSKKTKEILGCDFMYFKQYFEDKFTEGMNWELFLKGQIHIDHIIPLATAKTEEDVYGLCHYTNLQPLWAADNLKKGNKIISFLPAL